MPLADRADWSGVDLKIHPVGTDGKKKFAHLIYDGRQYATDHEVMVARLLTEMGVAFTPNVRFEFPAPPRFAKRRVCHFVPDFVFDRKAYIWTDSDGSEELIHGLEVKGASKREKRFTKWAREKVEELKKHRGIVIKLISNDEARHFFDQGHLPIRPLGKK